ncbi:MAG TPA: HEAT repeat domain-containing protein [Candidatus Acidoferrum sp.]|nr:HEAT repeat domain-containing protein [Candidatus Acidoferrum sp.]
MGSIFEKLWRLGPAAFAFKAIIAAIVADGLLLAFIFVRRTYRKRFFARRDKRVLELRQQWDALISGRMSYDGWRMKAFDRGIVEAMALDAFEAAGPEESARLLKFMRVSGLIEKRIFEAQHLTGSRRMRALVALGRTRAPEGVPALAEALRDRKLEIRLAALRGLGRTACPQAGEEILTWIGESGLTVPALPLQSALIQCCAERPQLLLPFVKQAEGPLREVLGRVLGEVAAPGRGLELLQFVADEREELRAAAARAMSHTADARVAFDALSELAEDCTWFVRLRAIIGIGNLADPRAIPTLLKGLTDSNRLVRLRAAEALVQFRAVMVSVFQQVIQLRDRYGLHAYLTAIENAGLRERLESQLQNSTIGMDEMQRLRSVLQTSSLPPEHLEAPEAVTSPAGPRP